MNTPLPAGLSAIVELTRAVYEAAGVPLGCACSDPTCPETHASTTPPRQVWCGPCRDQGDVRAEYFFRRADGTTAFFCRPCAAAAQAQGLAVTVLPGEAWD